MKSITRVSPHRTMVILCLLLVQLIMVVKAYAQASLNQKNHSYIIMDFIRVKDDHFQEAKFYYENNWKIFREKAIKLGLLQSCTCLNVKKDSLNKCDFILITTYADIAQYEKSEAYHTEFEKQERPNGFILLNELQPSDFRLLVGESIGFSLFESASK